MKNKPICLSNFALEAFSFYVTHWYFFTTDRTYLFIDILSSAGKQGRLNTIIGPNQSSALGPLPTQPLTGIKM